MEDPGESVAGVWEEFHILKEMIAMSVTTTNKSLLGKAFTPLGGPSRPLGLPVEPDFHITNRTRMLKLPGVALATLRFRAGPIETMHPGTCGMTTDACERLARWWARGSRMSAWQVALEFQSLYFPTGVSHYTRGQEPMRRQPLRGLDLIRATEEHGGFGVEWRCDVPREDDEFAFETVRLSEALERFAPTVHNPS